MSLDCACVLLLALFFFYDIFFIIIVLYLCVAIRPVCIKLQLILCGKTAVYNVGY